MELDTQPSDQQKPREKTEFAKRNPHLEKLVPDAIENAVDALIPDRFEKVMVAWDPVTILTLSVPPVLVLLPWLGVTHLVTRSCSPF